ncbi:MAG: aldehyde dehydrogenase family protein, partial [Bacteroidota bacterium]
METLALKYPKVKNYVAGKFTNGENKTMEVISPLTGKVISTVPLSSAQQLDEAVKAGQAAFPAWSAMPIKERVQIFYRYKTLLEKHVVELSTLVHEENGKTMDEARAEVEKSIELTEFACSLPQLISGEVLEV